MAVEGLDWSSRGKGKGEGITGTEEQRRGGSTPLGDWTGHHHGTVTLRRQYTCALKM